MTISLYLHPVYFHPCLWSTWYTSETKFFTTLKFLLPDTSLSWVLLALCSPRRTVIHVPAPWLGVPGIKVHGRWWSLLQCPGVQDQCEQLRSSKDGELVWLCALQLWSPSNCLVSKWPWPLVMFHSSLSPTNMATGHEESWASFWEHIILEDKDGGIV